MKFDLSVRSSTRSEFVDITEEVMACVRRSQVNSGICVVYVPHTTAGLTINENYDSSVKVDLLAALDRLVPLQDNYRHAEGNSAAHIKASLMGCSHTLPVSNGHLALGTWQGIFLAEFDGPRQREVIVTVLADAGQA
jgi:secondary thiamine-phosphate synthase enzyme